MLRNKSVFREIFLDSARGKCRSGSKTGKQTCGSRENLLKTPSRATLKRLPAADRERIVESRAVPEDLDKSSKLYSAFPPSHQVDISSTTQPSYGFTEHKRKFTNFPGLGHRRDISGETSSGNIHSTYSEPLWTQDLIEGSQNISPVPPVDEAIHHTSSLAFDFRTPNEGSPSTRSRRSPAIYGTLPHPRSRIRVESLASPPSPTLTGAGLITHRNPALLHPPGQSQIRSPSNGRINDSPRSGEYPRHQSRSGIVPEHQLQQAQPSMCESSDYFSSAYTTFYHPTQLHQPLVSSPMFQFEQPPREIPSATSIPSSVYPRSASTEPNARAFPGVFYSSPHTGQVPYITWEGSTDDIENTEARQDVKNTPVVGQS